MPKQRPLIIGHRGLMRARNQLEGFRAALEQGADGIECDLRLAADGRLICVHDRQLQGQPAESLDVEQRRQLQIPDLEEVLELMEDCQAWLVLEPKTRSAADALLLRYDPDPQHMLISFSDVSIEQALLCGWQAGFLDGSGPEVLLDLAPTGARLGPSAMWAEALPDGELARCNVWTVNDLHQAERLAARGTWALTSDYPGQLLRLLS